MRAPKFFRHGWIGRAGAARSGENNVLERQWDRAKRLGQTKGQRTSGENFTRGITRRGRICRGEGEFNFMQGAVRVPELGRLTFADDFQSVVPGPLAQRTQCAETFFIKIHKSGGLVREFVQLHC